MIIFASIVNTLIRSGISSTAVKLLRFSIAPGKDIWIETSYLEAVTFVTFFAIESSKCDSLFDLIQVFSILKILLLREVITELMTEAII